MTAKTTEIAIGASPFGGASIFLMGAPGTGKTTFIKSIMDAGLDCFGLFHEPGYSVIAGDERLKRHYISPAPPGFEEMETMSDRVNTLTNTAIQTGTTMFGRENYRQFFDVLKVCNNYVDQRTGQEYGPINKWGTDRCFILDSVTGLTQMCKMLAVGAKPALTQPDYQIIMNHIQQFLNLLATGLHCWLYVTAHIEMERDEITGGNRIMPATIGRKLAPVMSVNFDDHLYAERDGDKFTLTVADPEASTKARHFPLTGKHAPDFQTIYDRWVDLGGVIETTPEWEGAA